MDSPSRERKSSSSEPGETNRPTTRNRESESDADSSAVFARRRVLRGLGGVTATMAGVGSSGAAVGQTRDGEASLTFEDQATDGDSVVLAELTMPVDGELVVQDKTDGENTRFALVQLSAGTYEEYTVELEQSVEESQTLQVWVFDGDLTEGNPEALAIESAFVSIGGEEDVDVLGVTYVDADSDSGFNYPYYLFTPPGGDIEEAPILVEPNNTGTATDDFETHREKAKQLAERGISRRISEELGIPLLVPVFPRPRNEPVDWTHYVHALDDTTLGIEAGPLERVDLQLLRMVAHAKEQTLSESSHSFGDRLVLNGFSASGNFVDRFTVLHPERVLSVTAGGLNGMPLLPLESADGHALDFHVGIANVESLVGEAVDLDALDRVNQFLYMGGRDDNDTIPYDDAWTDDELRQTALDVYGQDMIAERFPRSQSAYETAGVDAQFRVYEDAGHTPRPARDDIIEFHRRSIRGEDVGEFGQTLVAVPSIDSTPATPAVDESVEFDASGSEGGTSQITHYLWDFGDTETAVGETVTHTYAESGAYAVTLTIILDTGVEKEVTAEVTVSAEGNSSTETERGEDDSTETKRDTDDSTARETETEADDSSSSESVPGFGIASALGGLGSAGYLLKRRVGSDES